LVTMLVSTVGSMPVDGRAGARKSRRAAAVSSVHPPPVKPVVVLTRRSENEDRVSA
jgi:hypothetical protein